jgi:anti-sigma regulatory factor (Ser/Thr protein kinase)
MGQLRNALRAYALEDPQPQAVATRLNILSERLGAPNLVTLVYLLLDLSTLTLRYVRAGHLPPLVLGADGAAALLEEGHALPLGVNRDSGFTEGHARIRPGSTLILYTDGLVDRPDVLLDEALLHLREVALGAHTHGPEELLDELLRRVLPGGRHDDVAVLALQVAALGDALSLRLPAEPSSVAVLRQLLRRWFIEQGLTEEAAFPLLVASGEAVSNAIEHAYGPSGGQLQVSGTRTGEDVTVTVRDFGQWRPSRGSNRGRGFRLMEGLVDEVVVSHERDGTEVRLRRRVLREAPS